MLIFGASCGMFKEDCSLSLNWNGEKWNGDSITVCGKTCTCNNCIHVMRLAKKMAPDNSVN